MSFFSFMGALGLGKAMNTGLGKRVLFGNNYEGFNDYLGTGAIYTFGGEINSIHPRSIDFGGNRYSNGMKHSIAPGGMGSKMAMGMSAVTTLPFYYMGYQDGGFWGMAKAASADIAISSALARYGHSAINVGGVSTVVSGKYWGQQALHNWSAGSPGMHIPGISRLTGGITAATAVNTMSYIGRATGATVGYTAAQMLLGDGLLGSLGGVAGAALGARGSVVANAAALGGLGLGAIGYAGYSLAKTGYNHAQLKKGIQTSGDMSSFMTGGAQTMRQRAVQAIGRSQMNVNSALGSEANYMSMNRSYFSPYRMY